MPIRVAISSDDSRRNISWLGGWFDKNVRKSIKGKYVAYLVTGVLASSLLVGISNTIMMNRKVVDDATSTMNMHCQVVAGILNDKMDDLGDDITQSELDILAKEGAKEKIYDSEVVFIIADGMYARAGNATEDDIELADYEVSSIKDIMTDVSSGKSIYGYRFIGFEKKMAYCTLDNGMRLAIAADQNEMFDQTAILVILNILIASGVSILVVAVGYRFVLALTKPIEELSVAAQTIGTGDLNTRIPGTDMEDEVGDLARSFRDTRDHLHKYVDYIQTLAYKDALTDMQNKAAYDKSMEQMDVKARLKTAEFAIVMIDLNFLKRVNDTYGHEIGNRYILTLCSRIASIFPIEEIYRIGGDEFVVILKDDYYKRRDELVERFKETMTNYDTEPERPWEKVSAAVGMSVYDPRTDSGTDEVFKRADAAMYENKIAMKGARE